MNSVFPDEFSFVVVRINQVFMGLLAILVIFTPPDIFIRSHMFSQICIVGTLGYTIFSLVKAVIHKRTGALSMLLGLGFWFLTVINDILYYYVVIDTTNLAPLGLLALIFSQVFLLSMRFNRAFKLVEVVQGPHVSDESREITMALCEKIGKVPVHLKKEVNGFLLNRIYSWDL